MLTIPALQARPSRRSCVAVNACNKIADGLEVGEVEAHHLVCSRCSSSMVAAASSTGVDAATGHESTWPPCLTSWRVVSRPTPELAPVTM